MPAGRRPTVRCGPAGLATGRSPPPHRRSPASPSPGAAPRTPRCRSPLPSRSAPAGPPSGFPSPHLLPAVLAVDGLPPRVVRLAAAPPGRLLLGPLLLPDVAGEPMHLVVRPLDRGRLLPVTDRVLVRRPQVLARPQRHHPDRLRPLLDLNRHDLPP